MLKKGKSYKVTIEVTPTKDISKKVITAAICNGVFKTPVKSVEIGTYTDTDEEDIINI